MGSEMCIRDRNVQFKKGALELCVLTLLRQGEKYGYELAEAISGEISISEGTIYPILRRLRNEGYFEVTLRESPEGPPRKYYRLTQKGKKFLQEKTDEWKEYSSAVSKILEGGLCCECF